jgi:hypothetical protein
MEQRHVYSVNMQYSNFIPEIRKNRNGRKKRHYFGNIPACPALFRQCSGTVPECSPSNFGTMPA